MWESRIVPKPNRSPRLIKSSIREIPVTISAFSIGMLVIPIKIALFRLFMLDMAIQAIVPIMEAAKAERNAISRVVPRAFRIVSSCMSERYQFTVKPPHFALVLLALKESTISVAIGAYRKIKISATYIFLTIFIVLLIRNTPYLSNSQPFQRGQ